MLNNRHIHCIWIGGRKPEKTTTRITDENVAPVYDTQKNSRGSAP